MGNPDSNPLYIMISHPNNYQHSGSVGNVGKYLIPQRLYGGYLHQMTQISYEKYSYEKFKNHF